MKIRDRMVNSTINKFSGKSPKEQQAAVAIALGFTDLNDPVSVVDQERLNEPVRRAAIKANARKRRHKYLRGNKEIRRIICKGRIITLHATKGWRNNRL